MPPPHWFCFGRSKACAHNDRCEAVLAEVVGVWRGPTALHGRVRGVLRAAMGMQRTAPRCPARPSTRLVRVQAPFHHDGTCAGICGTKRPWPSLLDHAAGPRAVSTIMACMASAVVAHRSCSSLCASPAAHLLSPCLAPARPHCTHEHAAGTRCKLRQPQKKSSWDAVCRSCQ